MPRRPPERESFYADILCAAAEDGGVNGWRVVKSRKYYMGPDLHHLLGPAPSGGNNYRFSFYHTGNWDEGEYAEDYPVLIADLGTLVTGFGILRRRKHEGLADSHRDRYMKAFHEMEAGEFDAFDADWVMQLGLFGEVIYS